ncbi:MAG: hypothetical protein AB8B86_13485 [Pseudomonadales bacterium]
MRFAPTVINVLYGTATFAMLLAHCATAQSLQEDDGIDSSIVLLSDDNLLIVEIQLDNYILASDVFMYSSNEGTVIPLQALFDAIEFPISVDAAAMTASGWFQRESQNFELRGGQRKVSIGGQSEPIEDTKLLLSDGIDLYADIALLERWFPIKINVDTGRLRIRLSSTEPLPLEKQLARERKRARDSDNISQEHVPLLVDRYQLLGAPIVDVNIGSSFTENNDVLGESTESELDMAFSIQASADILGLQASFSSSRTSFEERSFERLTFYRRPVAPGENMPANIAYAALGDVFGASDALIFNGGQGLGFDLEFGEARRSSDFGKRVIEGDAAPGWEVEIHRNGVYLGFQLVQADGRYHFDDIPVEYGQNLFDITLYGPNGQEKKRQEAINIGSQALPKGEFYARLSYIDRNNMLFFNERSSSSADAGIGTLNTDLPAAKLGEEKLYLAVQAGLSDRLSANLSLAQHKNAFGEDNQNQYLQLGLSGALTKANVDVQFAQQNDGGNASLISAQTRFNKVNISYLQKHFEQFESDRNANANLKDYAELRFSGVAALFNFKPMSYQLIGNYVRNTTGNIRKSITSSVGFQAYKGRLNVDTEAVLGNSANSIVIGSASFLRNLGGGTNLRAGINYSLEPKWQATSAAATMVWRSDNNMYQQLSINGSFTQDAAYSMGYALSKQFEYMTLSGHSQIHNDGDISFLLSAEFSFSQENRRKWVVRNKAMANEGRLKTRVFLDHDYDGVFSPADEPIAGVRFSGRQDWKAKATQDDGIVYLPGLRAQTSSRLLLEKESLADPYWRTEFERARIVSHPGGLQHLDIPVAVTSEAEGSIALDLGVAQRPLGGIPMIARTKEGKIIAEIISEFDGYFILEGLLPGSYWLEVSPEALARFSVDELPAIAFTIVSGQGTHHFDPILLQAALSVVVN